MKAKWNPAAIIMSTVTLVFIVGTVAFVVARSGEASKRSDLEANGVEQPVTLVAFVEQDARRLNPNTGRFDRYSDDQVEFSFEAADGRATAVQPISRGRFLELRNNRSDLTARYLADAPEEAELLEGGDYVAGAPPWGVFAIIAGVLALLSAGISLNSWRSGG